MSRCIAVLTASIGIGVVAAAAFVAHADTVVTKDGRRFSGEVTHPDSDYVIKTRFGEVHVGASDFDHLEKDGAAAPASAKSTVTPAAPRTAAVSPGPSAKKQIDPKTLEALLQQGHDALAAGEYKSARDAFTDASSGADKNADAWHGLGLSYMYLNDFAHAREPMEKAILAAGPSASRALVLNMCVCQIGLKNPMRGAKIVMDYLATHQKDLDEPMLNAMGTALNVADAQAKKGGLFQQCVTFYVAYNAKLESQNIGYKRWGVAWERASDVDRRNSKNAAAEREMARLDKECDGINRDIDREQRELDRVSDLMRRGFMSEFDVQQAQQVLKGSTDKRTENQKAYDAQVAKLEHPSFPRAMTLVAMDDLTPPPVGGQTAVAQVPAVEMVKAAAPRRASTPVKKASDPKTTTNEPPPEAPPQITVTAQPAPKRNVRITTYAAAFPVGENLLITAAASVANATEIIVQTSDGTPLKAQLVRADASTGLALLRVTDRRFIPLGLAPSFTGGALQCAAYPSVNIFTPAAESIAGTAKSPAADWKVALSRHPRLGGSPLLAGGQVVGVELANRDTEPGSVPAATVEQVRAFLGADMPTGLRSAAPDPLAALLQLSATRESTGG